MPEYTREHIVTTFNRLVQSVGFQKITVSMVVKEANISRATFYRYFKDKYDVMNYNYKKMVDDAFDPGKTSTLEDVFLIFYRKGRTYWQPLVRMFDSTGYNSLFRFIGTYSYDAAKKVVEENRGVPLTEQEQLQLKTFCGGCSYMYEDWIRGKYTLTPEEAASALYSIVPENFKGYLWSKVD